jgi:head-tail adaptor
MALGAGDLDARVRFDARGADANGDPLGDFVPGFTVGAKVDYLRGSESAVSNRLQGLQPVTITVRDSTQSRTITNAFRAVIVSGRGVRVGETLNITAVAPAQDLGFTNIMATSGGAAG